MLALIVLLLILAVFGGLGFAVHATLVRVDRGPAAVGVGLLPRRGRGRPGRGTSALVRPLVASAARGASRDEAPGRPADRSQPGVRCAARPGGPATARGRRLAPATQTRSWPGTTPAASPPPTGPTEARRVRAVSRGQAKPDISRVPSARCRPARAPARRGCSAVATVPSRWRRVWAVGRRPRATLDGRHPPRRRSPRARPRSSKVDRNLAELNGEARVVVTGVQVLFAFARACRSMPVRTDRPVR